MAPLRPLAATFFDPYHPTYPRIAAITRLCHRPDRIGLALRRGRQYLRETSFLGQAFAIPRRGELVAWSRILFDQAVLVALNSHGTEAWGAHVTVDASLHPAGSSVTVLYCSDWSDAELRHPPLGQTVPVHHCNGRATVRLDLPPAGMVILAW